MQTTNETPFHAGEHAVQSALGVREQVAPWARRAVHPYLTQQLRDFFAQLPWVVATARDDAGRPWVTLLSGEPGFAHSPTPQTLRIEGTLPEGDALTGQLEQGADLGLLGIEPHTRRRNRTNGRIAAVSDSGLHFEVGQAFGNCPQYIVARHAQAIADSERPPRVEALQSLDEAARQWIERADTLLLGSGIERTEAGHESEGLDASHRGGAPGFVLVEDAHSFVIPDYAGNNLYNTLGNLHADPRIAVTFVDFESGSLLQITGRAELDFARPDPVRFPGALRLVRVSVDAVRRLTDVLPMRYDAAEGSVREYRIVERIVESADVTSFLLEGRGCAPLPTFQSGQHLPLEFVVGNGAPNVKRSYSLSASPEDALFRISVKREPEGLVSRHLHDALEKGEIVLGDAPAGEFALAEGDRPIVLLAGGIGVTPLVSMFRTLAARKDARPILFAHGVRDGRHHPFAMEVDALVQEHGNAHRVFAYSRPRSDDSAQDHSGRLDLDVLRPHLATLDADYYLCGPAAFVAELEAALEDAGVPTRQIRSETF